MHDPNHKLLVHSLLPDKVEDIREFLERVEMDFAILNAELNGIRI